jgi:hypothetical protein
VNPDIDYLLGLMSAAPPAGQDELAAWFYARGYVVRYPSAPPVHSGEGPGMMPELAAANRGRAGWDAGWFVEFMADDGSVIAVKEPARRRFEPGGFVTHGMPGIRPKYGDTLSAFAPVELRSSAEAFYFAFGEAVDPFHTPEDQVRLYWNVTAAGAVPLVAAVTREFNRFQLPFQFKCVWRPEEFYRLDAAVLYLNHQDWDLSSKLLRRVHDEIAPWLGPDVPMLTKRLAPGLALAENPPGGRSFGQHRSELVGLAARAISNLPEAGDDARIAALTRAFGEAGLDLERPYLNPDSTDRYDLP